MKAAEQGAFIFGITPAGSRDKGVVRVDQFRGGPVRQPSPARH